MTSTSRTWWGAAFAIAAVLGAAVVVAIRLSQPAVAWLDDAGPASWIVYPSPAFPGMRAIVELDATFHRSFHLDAPPNSALLRIRALRAGLVRINGREVTRTTGADWKAERRVEVGGLLRAGENDIEGRVSNAAGPPALWLVLEMPGMTVVSDEHWTSSWAGAADRLARRATDPSPGRRFDPEGVVGPSVTAAAREWRRLLSFAALLMLAVGAITRLRKLRPDWTIWSPSSPWPVRLVVALGALFWVALFVNNSPLLPSSDGFDGTAHLEYARFIQENRAIPFADDGWQMFQPPLYYAVLAIACSSAGVSATAPEAAAVVRTVGLGVGLAHLALLGACLRLLVPERPRAQLAGVLIGAFLPCMLCLHQYPANEPLVAMLSSAALLILLRLVKEDEPRLVGHALLGLLLGLALLAKLTALLLLPIILGTLTLRALVGGARSRTARLVSVAACGGVVLATCGWYYARVWQKFGTPFVGGWDARRGMGWWLDPGYRTMHDFLRFGRAFTTPLFAGFDGVWDGLYVTFWGDGLLSGMTSVAFMAPWWSPSLMSAGLLLAVVPAVSILCGGAATAVRWIRHPVSTTGALVWLAFLVMVSIVLMTIAVPAVAAAKGSYGLIALVPLCAFTAYALELAARRKSWVATALLSILGVWALTSFATYWIDGDSSKARLLKGFVEVSRGNESSGLALMRKAHAIEPDDWSVRIVLADHLLHSGGSRSEIVGLLAPGQELPDIALRHVVLAGLAREQGDEVGAERALRHALALDPDNFYAHAGLAPLRGMAGDLTGAVTELREVLRIDPQDEAAHRALSRAYATLGDPVAAAAHEAYAVRRARGLRAVLR